MTEAALSAAHGASGGGLAALAATLAGLFTFDPATLALRTLRVVALLGSAPVFGHGSVPARLRIALGLAIALAVAPPEAAALAAATPGTALAATLLGELVIGLSIGFATRLVFAGIGLVGEIIGMQGGLGAAMALDPTSGISAAALSGLLRTIAILVFLAIDGHHALIEVAQQSFVVLPPGSGALEAQRFVDLFRLGAVIFEIGVQLAAPVMVAMFCANLAVGVLGRAMPQLNLITLQLPALVGVTFLLLGLGAGELSRWIANALQGWPERVLGTLGGMG